MRRYLPLLKALLASAALVAVAATGLQDARNAAPLHVVLITLDTTRADRLPAYGAANIATPGLDRLARDGVVFDHASSVAPLTLPAHCSLFTGLFPPVHGVRDNASPPLGSGFTTVAEALKANGFRTAAFVGSVVLASDRGLAQGFDEYSGVAPANAMTPRRFQRPANEVMDEAIAWLDKQDGSRLFLWAHLYDPHAPYAPPEPYRSRYADDLYSGEIAFADAEVVRLLDTLERRRLLDRTLVIVAGDHGESLGEHGEEGHGIFIYDSVTRVPLIIRSPGFHPRRITEVVRLVDLMPTMLDILNVKPSDTIPGDGISLKGLMAGTDRGLGLEAYAESMYPRRFGWSPLRSLSEGRFKMIDAPRRELYDLEQDPFEQRNLALERPALLSAMTKRLDDIAAHVTPDAAADEVPAELRDRLAALGYVGSTVDAAHANQTSLPDPKDCFGLAVPCLFTTGTPAVRN